MIFADIKNQIEKKIKQTHYSEIILREKNNNYEIDFFVPLFVYAKKFNENISDIFQKLKIILLEVKEIESIDFVNGFLNIKLKRVSLVKKILFNVISKDHLYGTKELNQKTVVVDYSSPNIAKHFSIGHLRSTVIGNSLCKIYQKLGFKVISINHLGDWGTQFGKLILAYQKWSNEDKIIKDPINELQKLYVFFHEQAKIDDQLNVEAKNIFYQLEQKNDKLIKLWTWFKEISLKEFMKIYQLLGVKFDYFTGESFYNDQIPDVIKELKQKQLLKLDQNAYIIELKDLIPALIQKDNGSALYLTRDLTALLYRFHHYHCDKILYVVGNEQKLHFQQLQQIVFKMGYNLSLTHVNFGLVLLQGKKLSTRSQKFVRLIDVIDEVKMLAKTIIQQKNPHLHNIDEIAIKIAIGSIIFNDLKNDRHLEVDFDIEKMIQFEGQTGSYLQYTLVRIYSILKKIKTDNVLDILENNFFNEQYYLQEHYYFIIELLDQFPHILEKVAKDNMPSFLARYLLKLAKKFNYFYFQEKVINNDLILQNTNLLIVKAVFIVLKEGLILLGIPVLEEM